MEANYGRVAWSVVDGEDVEAAGVAIDVTLGDEALGSADYDALFIGGDAEFGQGGEFFAQGAGADFHEGQGFTVIAYQVEFAFYAARRVIARNEDVAVAAKIPVGVGFSADAGAAGLMFALGCGIVVFGWIAPVVAEAFPRGPMDELEDSAGDQGHDLDYKTVNVTNAE